MGEIGFSRREFLFDLRWWEVKAVIRGYNARHHPGWEQARLIAYNARFCMGSKDPLPTITEWIKFPWDKVDDTESGQPISNVEAEKLRRKMREWNEQHTADVK